MVKADKARGVEDMLLRMAQTGQLPGKVSESQLIDLLEQINKQAQQETKIVVWIKKYGSVICLGMELDENEKAVEIIIRLE
jgi:hypothetical protein